VSAVIKPAFCSVSSPVEVVSDGDKLCLTFLYLRHLRYMTGPNDKHITMMETPVGM